MCTPVEHHRGRRRGGLCRSGGSGDRTPTRARPPHVSPPPMPWPWDAAHREARKDARISGHRLAVDATGHVRVWSSGRPLHGAAPLPGERLLHEEKMLIMRVVLLLLMATCLTGCVPRFPFYCEDDQASICYLQRRPIFAPRDKPPSARTSERREGAWPDAAPQRPEALGAPRHTDASVTACVFQARRARDA
jgi:hypothetical protein